MKYKILISAIFFTFILSNETLVHISSTYFDGTPKQIIIYEYSTLYSNNPLRIVDTLNFDKDGNLIYDFNSYFNSNWNSDMIGTVQIENNQFKVLDSASCLGCYSYMDDWKIATKDNQFYVNLNGSVFLDKDLNEDESTYNFQIHIQSIDSFTLKLGSFEYNFIRSKY